MSDDLVKLARAWDENAPPTPPFYATGGLIFAMADRIEELEAQLAAIEEYGTEEINEAVDLRQQLAKAVDAVVDVAASLTAALYLLERGGKKAAPSDKMFAQMLVDYSASLDRARATVAELKGENDE